MENIDIMNDSELDLFARKAFITSMESSSTYVSPVSLIFSPLEVKENKSL